MWNGGGDYDGMEEEDYDEAYWCSIWMEDPSADYWSFFFLLFDVYITVTLSESNIKRSN